jgi:hypothetical protein
MNLMPRYPSSPRAPSRATLVASSTKARTAGRSSSARQATHSEVVGTPLPGGKAGVLGDRDEVPQVPEFDVHREHNLNLRASKGRQARMKATREAANQ